ncbi:unnamed protein product [Meloidogyne enterolobii]|uniref:Uncharacterized protein n=3 Tax=Meloidogyne enterolobii TaxID=390850 RepID=A0ACB0ZUK5_MELEN
MVNPGSRIPIVSRFQKSFSSTFSVISPTADITYCVSSCISASFIFALPQIIGPTFVRSKNLWLDKFSIFSKSFKTSDNPKSMSGVRCFTSISLSSCNQNSLGSLGQ